MLFHSAGLHFNVDLLNIVSLAVYIKAFRFFLCVIDWNFIAMSGNIDSLNISYGFVSRRRNNLRH